MSTDIAKKNKKPSSNEFRRLKRTVFVLLILASSIVGGVRVLNALSNPPVELMSYGPQAWKCGDSPNYVNSMADPNDSAYVAPLKIAFHEFFPGISTPGHGIQLILMPSQRWQGFATNCHAAPFAIFRRTSCESNFAA